MKKKFVLVLALVLMAAVAVTAAPVTLTGSFKAGYTFSFPGVVASNTPEINTDGLALTGDFWKVGVASDLFTFGDDNAVKGTLTVYLDKALAANGVDMGDVTATFAIGNSGVMSGPTVYTDPNGTVSDNSYKVRMAGTYSSALTLGYGTIGSVYFAFSPVKTTVSGNDADGSVAGRTPIVIGATVNPIDGVSAAVAFTDYAQNKFDLFDTTNADNKPVKDVAKYDTKGAIGGSVALDVAKLVSTDFALSVSAQDIYYLGQAKNYLLAAVSGGVGDVSAYAEYQLFDQTSNVIAKVSYSGIKNASMYAKLSLNDLSSISTEVSAGASYAMGGVTYALDGTYKSTGKVFELTPSMKVTF
jgi:hypothetical protein